MSTQTLSALHAVTRVQHEMVRRRVTVAAVDDVTPAMRRITFASDALRTFTSAAHDDHVKIFFPAADTTVGRDFTPRRFDAALARLTVDFAMHPTGPAANWARQAKPGDVVEIGGPRGSLVVPDDFDWYLMAGDETALPAIARRLEELRPGVPVTTVVVVANDAERQDITTAAAWTPVWVTRDRSTHGDEAELRHALDDITLPAGDGHAWLAGESAMTRSLRTYLIDDRGHPADRVRAAGYWKRGAPGAHERFA
jgi:NADPH-dependent ferric siderophore reductase